MNCWELCCGNTDEPTSSKVVLLTGPTCSGKSTIADKLSKLLNPEVKNPKVIAADDHFDWDSFANDTCTMTTVGNHTWKNWEVPSSVDWEALIDEVEVAKSANIQRFVIVEGFLLCFSDRLMDLAYSVIHIDVSDEEIWKRRLSRAKSMKGLPEKMGIGTNFEVLPVYTTSKTYEGCKSAAERIAGRMPKDDREYAWLRLYFEELIIPAVQKYSRMSKEHRQCLVLDGTKPNEKEQWIEDAFLKCQKFLTESVQE